MRKWFPVLFTPNAWDIFNWLQAALPFLTGGGAVIIGIYDDFSLMWVIVAGALAFAGTAIGVVGFRMSNFQRNPEHKLIFVKPLVARGEMGANIGFEVRNDAVFPIDVRINELRTNCSQRIPPIVGFLNGAQFQLSPGETKFCHDAAIALDDVADKLMIGGVLVKLSYGKGKLLRYNMSKDLNLFIPFDAGLPYQWNDHIIERPQQEKPT